MTARQDKLTIGVMRPRDPALAAERADEAVLRLARLLGRQMAREQVAAARAEEARHQHGRSRTSDRN
jgi:hypothetical protein